MVELYDGLLCHIIVLCMIGLHIAVQRQIKECSVFHTLVQSVYMCNGVNIKLLLKLLYYSSQNGWTPLMTASFNGHVDIVRILIDAKAQINTQEEVCYSHNQKTLYNTSSYTVSLYVASCTKRDE